MSKALTILGSTGSIGVNALKLVDQYPERFRVVGLAAGGNVELLAEQAKKHKPLRVSIHDPGELPKLRAHLGADLGMQLLAGEEGLLEVAASSEADLVISAIVGFAGVKPTLAAIEAGKDIALANKETIVAAGPLIMNRVAQKQVKLIPVDSEHSAIFQALHGNMHECNKLKRLILTSSGGPFLHTKKFELTAVTAKQALKHPTWNMGAKITIDSATMMNKGLEVIEATQLFGVRFDQVDIVIHPECIIHSLIEYNDGSQLAQLGITDMRGPLAYAMGYPERLPGALPSLDLTKPGKLTFLPPDFERFPCLKLAYQAAEIGKSLPVVLNAANEICVHQFLAGSIGFLDIPRLISRVMELHKVSEPSHIDQVYDIDQWARGQTRALLSEKGVIECQV